LAKRKKIFKRTPKSDEYVVWRNRKGKLVKPRGGVYLIGEIRSRKTGKRTGFLNSQNKETKKPNFQRFTTTQRAILTTPRVEMLFDKTLSTTSWIMTNKKPLIEQVPKRVTTRVNKEIEHQNQTLVAINVDAGVRFNDTTPARYFDRKIQHKVYSSMAAIDILNLLKESGFRMSPKQKSNQNRRLRNQIKCTLVFQGLS